MRIGILTLPFHINYGGILQGYALQTILERLGHEVVIYQRVAKHQFSLPLWKLPLVYAKRICLRLFVNKNQVIFVEQRKVKELPVIRQHTNNFIKDHIHTIPFDSPECINISEVDCIIVGSDQIWRPLYVRKVLKSEIENAFLKFTEGWKGKRIAYAASFGVDEWEYSPEQTKECRRLVKYFDAVSVREDFAVQLCVDYLNVKAIHVLDPTLLLSKEDYIKLIMEANVPKSDGTLFSYILDEAPEKQSFVDNVARNFNMKPFNIGLASSKLNAPLERRVAQPVEKWLRGFYDAKFIVTDSFHGCVFSIIFEKPFVVIDNEERGMLRIKSLLSMFNMEGRLIKDFYQLPQLSILVQSNYSMELDSLREKSLDFLKDALTMQSESTKVL